MNQLPFFHIIFILNLQIHTIETDDKWTSIFVLNLDRIESGDKVQKILLQWKEEDIRMETKLEFSRYYYVSIYSSHFLYRIRSIFDPHQSIAV